jgi:hypothetical protein
MLVTILTTVLAIPTAELDILPMNEYHPAVMYDFTPVESFFSFGGVSRDIQQLERLAGQRYEKHWAKLPLKGKLQKNIWPGPYWPAFKDGINQRWAGENSLSPVEKYAKAFKLNSNVLANAVSGKSGISFHSGHTKKCKSGKDCTEGICSIRRGSTEGNCIPRWLGVCHAWAPVSIIEDEPMKAITVNGVIFEPLDIKALITQIYDTAQIGTIFTGRRCHLQTPPKDSNGRFVNEECRDISPSFFHLTLTNYIARFGRSFVADVTANYQVWNHPVVGYEIVQQRKISAADTMKQFFPAANSPVYTFNSKAKELVHVQTRMDYVTESDENISGLKEKYTVSKTYEYILELDKQGGIIGGEWTGKSKVDHPDFFFVPVGPPKPNTSILGGIKYSEVKKMIELAQ